MKAMMLAFAALIVISIGADFALNSAPFSSADRNAGESVRLHD